MRVDLSEIAEAFPDFRVGVVVAADLAIPARRPSELDALIRARAAATRAAWAGRELGDIPGIRAWRLAYKQFGIKSTRYRCSVERLVKNVLAERDAPEINAFVDAYNAVSSTHVFPLGADDLDRLDGDLFFRFARDGDDFLDMAAAEEADPADRAPKPGEVVYTDAVKVLCRRWNWRQDARSLVSPSSRRVVLTVQSLGVGDLDAALADVCDLITRFCGGRTAVTLADSGAPVKEIALPT
ncbi:MAG: phenylalanine--tRNA ligase beta subunit-related protein [Siculibacillus sp.]